MQDSSISCINLKTNHNFTESNESCYASVTKNKQQNNKQKFEKKLSKHVETLTALSKF